MFSPDNDFILSLLGTKPGPKTIVQGCTHGNERVGKQILEFLATEISPEVLQGELVLILGNPEAYEQNTRYVDEDMNRLLDKVETLQDSQSYESHRVLEILPYYQGVDYLLDIHATITPSVPFVYCEDTKPHQELAQVFETQYIIRPERDFDVPGLRACFDNYADALGGIGLTYEAGQIGNEEDFDTVYQKTMAFLLQTGNLSKTKNHPTNTPEILTIFEAVYAQTDEFQYLTPPANFQAFSRGDIIAYDDSTEIQAPKDCCLIFPKLHPSAGALAAYLARSNS